MGQRYSKTLCEQDHTGEIPQEVLDSLPENQGHPVRHRCAACAYQAGMNEAAEDVRQLVDQVRRLTEENERLKSSSSNDTSDSQPSIEYRADARAAT